jgi:hypothetical protein
MATLIKILEKCIDLISSALAGLIVAMFLVVVFLTILAKGFIRSVKQGGK